MPSKSTTGTYKKRKNTVPLLFSLVTLAYWQLYQTWKLLVIIGIGIIAAIMLICVMPLYSDITLNAGLYNALTSSPQATDIQVQSNSGEPVSSFITQTTTQLNQIFKHDLGPYIATSQFSIETQELPLFVRQKGSTTLQRSLDVVDLYGTSIPQARQHIHVVKGRLPDTIHSDTGLEIALSQESANFLHLKIGSTLTTQIGFFSSQGTLSAPTQLVERNLTLHVVGIFDPYSASNPFWHGKKFLSSPIRFIPPTGRIYPVLMSNQDFISLLTRAFARSELQHVPLELSANLTWYYTLNASHITVYNLNDVITGIQNAQNDAVNTNELNLSPYSENSSVILPIDTFENYKDRIPLAQIPMTGFLILVLCLVLFFITMMTDLLVERQTNVFAQLRSRGATSLQVFGSFVVQSIILGLIGLLIGPVLALFSVSLLATRVLPASDQVVLTRYFGHPVLIASRLSWFAISSMLITILAMTIAVGRSQALNILKFRREAGRSSYRTLWQRLNLDLIGALIALIIYGASIYLLNSNIIDTQLRLSLLSPLTLTGIVFLLIACILLFLRLFPFFLHLGTRVAAKGRGVTSMLAMTQIARAPRQSLRLILFLALATTFTLFTIIFASSQVQRVQDVANYQAGADFSGKLSVSYFHNDFDSLKASYTQIPGVTAVTLGDAEKVNANDGTQALPIEIRALEPETFSQTAVWSTQDSSQPLATLMQSLITQRANALANNIIPADVDTAMWNTLHLSLNKHFTLSIPDAGDMNFMAIAKVQHIPTINDDTIPTATTDYVPVGGLIVDYTSYSQVFLKKFALSGLDVPLNYVWLRTNNNTSTLNTVRAIMGNANACCLQVDALQDRRNIVNTMLDDPLYLGLIGILTLGAITVMLLALIGNLIASWITVRNRMMSFMVLRALGATPHQIVQLLIWEQSIAYATGIILGCIAGLLLSALVLPYVIYTNVAPSGTGTDLSSGAFYVLQNVPPVRVIIPGSSSVVLLCALIGICIIALFLMIRIVSQSALSSALRLSED